MKGNFLYNKKSQAMTEYILITTLVVITTMAFLSWGKWLKVLRNFTTDIMNNICMPVP